MNPRFAVIRIGAFLLLSLPWVAASCGGDGGGGCPATDRSAAVCDVICPACELPADPGSASDDSEVGPDVPVIDLAVDAEPDVPSEDPGPVAPTWWTAEATQVIDDLRFIEHQGRRIFGLGVHPSRNGAWDGVSGPNECRLDEDSGLWLGLTNDGTASLHGAAGAGANFVYTWGYQRDPEYLKVDPPFLGIWHPQYGEMDAAFGPGTEAIPIAACEHGEIDLDGYNPAKVAQVTADFEDFKARRGRWSPEALPNLPSYEEMPWFCWHPTFRMKGGGTVTDEVFTDAQADLYAKATNFMIGDTYTYVCNRWEGVEAILMGQDGPMDECYDDWLARDDPKHRSYFDAAWSLAHSLRARANPDAVVWMWMQGHGFDDDIGNGICRKGTSDLWAKGPFPTLRYLRKEMMSTIVAGGTGLVFFGYGYNRAPEAAKVRSLIRALAWEEVHGPALLSPRLDVGQDLTFTGEGGRAHLMVKWDASSRQAFILGANPGAHMTPFEVTFPWTVAHVELLDWWTPSWLEEPEVTAIEIVDRTVRWVAPQDDGFVMRVTPAFPPQAPRVGPIPR